MRFVPFLILAYVMLGLQVGIESYVKIHGAGPNLALLAVVFIALNASRDGALLGSFAIGLMQDLLTIQPPGLYALSYGLLAMLIVAMHHSLKRDHPGTHIILTAIGGLITAMILILHSWIHPAGSALPGNEKIALRPIHVPITVELVRVLYTTMLAPIVLVALGRVKGIFGFQGDRRNW